VTVALRPESIQLSPAANDVPVNGIRAQIDQIIYRGLSTHYLLRRPNDEPLIVIRQNEAGANQAAGLVPGASVVASWAAERNLIVRDDA
jgi:ABC-type Fe3+/spermidine/putrescine transport system ATPase subunit